MTPDAWEREQPCQNCFGKDKVLRVYVDSDTGRIGIHTPPGDVASLSITQAEQHQGNVAAAVLNVIHRGVESSIQDLNVKRSHAVNDIHGEPRRIIAQAVDGGVDFGGVHWCRMDPDTADQLSDTLRLLAAAARFQMRQRSS